MLRAVSRIGFAAFTAFASLLLTGCPDEPRPEIGGKDAGVEPISHPTTSTKSSTIAVVEPIEQVIEPPPPAAKKPPCRNAPAWISRPPCVEDGYLYAAGAFRSKRANHLARNAAANRARRRIALALGAYENEPFKLTGSEIQQTFRCKGVTYALARVPHTEEGELKRCSALP
jgi:hypothetical protein